MGAVAIEQIITNRPYNKIEELLFNENISYSKLNKKGLDVLARSQSLNCLMDDRFTGLKHFWSAIAVDRPKTKKKLDENIETYREEGSFTNEEKIQYLDSLTGVYPIEMVVDDAAIKNFEKYKVPPLGEFDPALKIAWFIPKEIIEKKTKHGKIYWILRVTDSSSKLTSIKCWGIKKDQTLVLNKPYMAKLDYNSKWGFSTRSVKYNFKLVG